MGKWFLFIDGLTLLGCERSDEFGTTRGPAKATQSAAAHAVQTHEAGVSRKLKAFVIDLGGSRAATDENCLLSVSFGSVGTGTDSVTRGQIQQLLDGDPSVVDVQPYVVGREGEAVLCIRLTEEREADRLFDRIATVATNGYMVRVQTRSGRDFASSRDRKR
jgi:hypothetical protein